MGEGAANMVPGSPDDYSLQGPSTVRVSGVTANRDVTTSLGPPRGGKILPIFNEFNAFSSEVRMSMQHAGLGAEPLHERSKRHQLRLHAQWHHKRWSNATCATNRSLPKDTRLPGG